jgi:predicted DsbA family dithiol-disulfide isomerase
MTNSPNNRPPEAKAEPVSVVVVSDFVCPWCYIGTTALDRLKQEYPVEVSWAPFLLDPTVPEEGRVTEPRTKPGDPLTRVEVRAVEEGLDFARGRTFRPNSHLALEAAMYAQEQTGDTSQFNRALYHAHFETLENIGDIDTLVRIGTECGLDGEALRDALATRRYRAAVDEDIQSVQEIGVSAVPTFIFNNEYAIVGAEKYPAFQRMMEKLGYPPPPGAEPPPDTYSLTFAEPTEGQTGED